MAETTADVRRDIELTRERMTSTLNELEKKLHLTQIVRDNPWPAVGLAFGAGLLLSGSRADVKAAAATATATRGATSRLAPALDDIVGNLMQGLGLALQGHVDTLLDQVKTAIGAPTGQQGQGQQGQGNPQYQQPQGQSAGSASAALGQQDGGLDGPLHSGASAGSTGAGDTWSPHTADVSRSGGGSNAGVSGMSASSMSASGMTPSSAGSQRMPQGD